ncbi:hypothetical protein ACP70R_002996 [Stipagrostis hirtigluma subsp. patula]
MDQLRSTPKTASQYTCLPLLQEGQMSERAQVLREEVREMMIKCSNNLPETLDLIITLERLSLDYHYKDEIKRLLHVVYNSNHYDGDLRVVSLRFYLLRKSGYKVSSDVFLNFKDKEGNFAHADIRSLLSLYNAACLRTHGEALLDEAIRFSRRYLEGRLEDLESPLVEEVSSALETPLFRRVGILETRNYIPVYKKEPTRNDKILEFAKVNFNLLQLLYCEELKEVTLWWKELHAKSKLGFVRDRIVETYFWMSGASYEPTFSRCRILVTKITFILTIIDDIFDTFGTTEECMQLAEAIDRWDERATPLLPEYMKGFYLCLLETFYSFEDELGPKKSYRVFYLKETKSVHEVKRLVQAYFKEIKWRDEDYVPETMSEHLQVSLESIGSFVIGCAAFVGMGDIITKDTFEWILSYPELLKSLGIFVRLSNDLVSTKREQTAHHSASTVHCYMKEHGTTIHYACQKIKELTEDSWKDMLEKCLVLTEQPSVVPGTVLNLARATDNIYKQGDDAYTSSQIIKDVISLLFVEPIKE